MTDIPTDQDTGTTVPILIGGNVPPKGDYSLIRDRDWDIYIQPNLDSTTYFNVTSG